MFSIMARGLAVRSALCEQVEIEATHSFMKRRCSQCEPKHAFVLVG